MKEMNKKIFYKWDVVQHGKVIRCGVEDTSIEIFVEHIFPGANSTADRDLSEMQTYADQRLSEYNYTFKYKEIEIDFSDLE